MSDADSWFVYIVQCNDGSFYTGITTNLTRRIGEHNGEGVGAKYTRSRQPVCLVYCEETTSRSEASKREFQIKSLKRSAKEQLVRKSDCSGKDAFIL